MSKKSIDRKAVAGIIQSGRLEGRSDTEIYTRLSAEYFDRKKIAQLITGTVTEQRKKNHRDAQITLLVLLGISVVFSLLTVISMALNSLGIYLMFFVLFLPMINIIFLVQIMLYKASAYRGCAILVMLGVVQGFKNWSTMESWTIFTNLAFAGAIVGLCFYLDNKLFPNYSPNNMKPDSNGDYRVE